MGASGSRDRRKHSINADIDADQVRSRSHTEAFDSDDLLVTRRDTTFPIQLNTCSQISVDSAALVYEEGKEEVALVLGKLNSGVNGASLQVTIPADTPVTLYMLKISGTFEDGTWFSVELKQRIVVLFNAWSKNDGVFLEDDAWRQEYVLNSNGRLYIGNRYGSAWNLGLYRPTTLKAVLFVLETLSKLTFKQKRDPILVSRELSALINIQDDNGVIVGRWDGEYSDGKDPEFWTGSGAILEQFYNSGGNPVKYGQCWVFSGVLLTALRVLGIPSRSITNFNSAHDTNRNRSIDEYYTEEGDSVDYLSSGSDSIWNFHVWNEAWMSRPDLPAGFGGWQALDATPQEESPQGGGYRTGPAPVKAIRDGNSLKYDINFIIAEVNADIKRYVIDKYGVPKLYQVDTKTVGQGISTKSVGSWRREDVTHQYKYPEGTDWERRALYEGYKELLETTHDVEFSIPEAEYQFGEDVVLVVKAANKGRKQHRIVGKIQCQAVTYTRRILSEVETLKVDEKVSKGKTEEISMQVGKEIFSQFTGTKVYVKFTVVLSVHGTSQMFSEVVSFAPKPPEVIINGPDQLALGKLGKLLISFKNPLPEEMKNVTLNIDSDDIDTDFVKNIGTIGANAEFKYVLDMTPIKIGKYLVSVGLTSDKVELVRGEKEIEVIKSLPSSSRIILLNTLEIKSVDLNLESNCSAHRTSAYDYPGLVVRRGQEFSIDITTTKAPPQGSKVITRAVFQMVSKSIFNRISFEVQGLSVTAGSTFKLKLKPPADVCVGEYELILTVDEGGLVSVLDSSIKLIILFNPWCKDDSCHYPDTDDLDEYILNTTGRIWVGSSQSNYGRPWQFSQFSKDSLEVALWILDQMVMAERADPVKTARTVSALTNVQDDDGVLVGNWSGDYSGGTSPLDWDGSGAILAEFNKTKNPVKYGQCWVFSGVQTTLFRCLGLPARSITNFNSAHDTDFNRAVDKFYDENGDPISSDDSIWNFHVWNEAWMSRPDLPAGFGGWQALDATPQEESPQGGGYRLGPAPVRAVKLGQRMNFDVEFVISEVNADIRYYMVNGDGSQTLSRVNSTHVGKNISTKAVGSNERQDVTLEYKFKEGSTSERAALLGTTESEKQISVKLDVSDNIMIGEDFTVTATVTNKGSSARNLKVRLYGRTMLYTGAPGQLVRDYEVSEKFNARESKTFKLMVVERDYVRILQRGNFINLVCVVYDKEKKNSVIETENLRLKTPDIAITLPKGGLKLYQPAEIKVSFTNPLSWSLTKGKFVLNGQGYVQDAAIDITMVRPLDTASAMFKTIPVKEGAAELMVRFSSNQLVDILGDKDVKIVGA